MKRIRLYLVLVFALVIASVVGCTQTSAPATPSAAKPAEQAAGKPAEAKPTQEPAKKAEPTAAPKAEAKPAASKDLPSTIALGTSPTGAAYNSTATGVAKVASQFSPIKVIVKPTAGPNVWAPMLDSGEVHLGVGAGLDAGWAYTGGTGYDKAYKNIRVLLQGNQIVIGGFIVRADSDIKSIKDLKGKRVASEYGGNKLMHVHATVFLESVGLTWNDVTPVPVTDINNGQKALREGRVDACFGGSPNTATTLETDAAIGVRALNFGDIPPEEADKVPPDLVAKLRKHLPGEQVIKVKKEGYLKSDATLYQHAIYLWASAKLSPDAAYEITKALYENDKELQPIYDWLKGWKQATMFNPDPPAPYHDGAIRFWKEKGLWTPEAEANQKKLLAQ